MDKNNFTPHFLAFLRMEKSNIGHIMDENNAIFELNTGIAFLTKK
jgi:hypothetical protein